MGQKRLGLKKVLIFLFAVIILLSFVSMASATNGYFAHGYSVKHKALAGAGTALPLDSLAASSNPAGMVVIGDRLDVGISFFNPNREYTVAGAPSTGYGLTEGTVKSDSKWFVIPSIGYNRMMNNDYSLGLSIYGNGGMNTDYNKNSYFGSSPYFPTGVDLSQLFIVPTYARKFNPKHSFGISPILVYQRFEVKGLTNFASSSLYPTKLTNNGHDDSLGYGARIGYLGEITPNVFIGVSYQTKVYMDEFDDYSGLFAENGDFDIPRNWSVGMAFKFTSDFIIALDVQKIYYGDIKAINNPLTATNLTAGSLGTDNGPGFGWEDMTVIKIGAQWQSSPEWTWRAGFSTGNQPIPTSEMLFNILAPGVVEDHATFGLTKAIGDHQEIDFVVVRAFSHAVSGTHVFDPSQTIELKMDQWELTAGYSYKF